MSQTQINKKGSTRFNDVDLTHFSDHPERRSIAQLPSRLGFSTAKWNKFIQGGSHQTVESYALEVNLLR